MFFKIVKKAPKNKMYFNTFFAFHYETKDICILYELYSVPLHNGVYHVTQSVNNHLLQKRAYDIGIFTKKEASMWSIDYTNDQILNILIYQPYYEVCIKNNQDYSKSLRYIHFHKLPQVILK
jgi:hypothetical protein